MIATAAAAVITAAMATTGPRRRATGGRACPAAPVRVVGVDAVETEATLDGGGVRPDAMYPAPPPPSTAAIE